MCMLYIASPWRTHFINVNLYLLTTFIDFTHTPNCPPLVTTNLSSVSMYLCSFVCLFFCFRFHIHVRSEGMCKKRLAFLKGRTSPKPKHPEQKKAQIFIGVGEYRVSMDDLEVRVSSSSSDQSRIHYFQGCCKTVKYCVFCLFVCFEWRKTNSKSTWTERQSLWVRYNFEENLAGETSCFFVD